MLGRPAGLNNGAPAVCRPGANPAASTGVHGNTGTRHDPHRHTVGNLEFPLAAGRSGGGVDRAQLGRCRRVARQSQPPLPCLVATSAAAYSGIIEDPRDGCGHGCRIGSWPEVSAPIADKAGDARRRQSPRVGSQPAGPPAAANGLALPHAGNRPRGRLSRQQLRPRSSRQPRQSTGAPLRSISAATSSAL